MVVLSEDAPALLTLVHRNQGMRPAYRIMSEPNLSTGPDVGCLSLDQAAKFLGVSRRTIHRQITRGKLRPSKVGTRTLLTVAELSRFLEDCTLTASTAK